MTPADATSDAAVDAWARTSRFRCMALVLDLRRPEAAGYAAGVRSAEARAILTVASRAGARFVVLAGQLMRKKAGAFSVLINTDDADALRLAVAAAFEKLTDLGESGSLWFVAVDEPLRSDLLAFLASQSATEGVPQ